MASDAAPYEIIYWPGLPGRAEHIRLCFEEAGVPYSDVARDPAAAVPAVMAHIAAENLGDDKNPPVLAPPLLKHGDVLLAQSSNILLYVAPKLGLAPEPGSVGLCHVNGLALTALDGFSDEAHDTHHPIASSLYYEDQKVEASRRAKIYREERLPKFLAYFQRVLSGKTSGKWLYSDSLTYADLVLFQCIDGLKFAFPKAMARLEATGQYDKLFKHYEAVKERPNIKAYLASERRQKYGNGIYRHYPELDDQE